MAQASNGESCPYPAWPPPVATTLVTLPRHPCPYLPNRTAQMRGFWADSMSPDLYRQFMDAGFRRAGRVVYQPICRGCRQCLPLRVEVGAFHPDKAMRRCRRRNADLAVSIGPPAASGEKWELYRAYVSGWHGGDPGEPASFESFLYESPVASLEFSYRDKSGRLIAVGICDEGPKSLSSVYFYFDPSEASRSPGVFGALVEIAYAARRRIDYYYLGYWVDGCSSMAYKATYRAHQVLHPDNVWRRNK